MPHIDPDSNFQTGNIKAEAEGFYPNVNLSYIELHQDTSFVFELQKDLPDVTINFTDAHTGEAIPGVEVSWEGQVSNKNGIRDTIRRISMLCMPSIYLMMQEHPGRRKNGSELSLKNPMEPDRMD